jgi:hypothetical protein
MTLDRVIFPLVPLILATLKDAVDAPPSHLVGCFIPSIRARTQAGCLFLAKIFKREITGGTMPISRPRTLIWYWKIPINVARRVRIVSSNDRQYHPILEYHVLPPLLGVVDPKKLPGRRIPKNVAKRSGGMTDFETSGTIGYIDSGHGHSEGCRKLNSRMPIITTSR